MQRTQFLALLLACLAAFILYVGFRTKPSSFDQVEQTRAASATTTDVNTLIAQARGEITGPPANQIIALEQQLDPEAPDSESLKALSSAWYQLGYSPIAGHYAAEVAELEGTPEAWSIAGNTYSLALQQSEDDKIRAYCLENGVSAYEKAISLDPEEVEYRLNLALLYTEMPPQDNPMKGILMMVDLNKNNPDQPAVLFHLGRLAMKTGQTGKAVERLRQAAILRPEHRDTWCLLAQAEEAEGHVQEAQEASAKCETIH